MGGLWPNARCRERARRRIPSACSSNGLSRGAFHSRRAKRSRGELKMGDGQHHRRTREGEAIQGARGTGFAGPLGASPIPQERGEDAKRRRGVFRMRCLQMPPDRHPEPGVQVGEGSLALGSSDARRSRSLGRYTKPELVEHWFKEI